MTDYILGLTGPTGAGKSTVAEELRRQGCTIIDCDQISREVTTVCTPCLEELRQEFGAEVFEEDGTLNRQRLAKKAFSSAEKTKRLNAITHPWICRRIGEEIQRYRQQGSDGGILVLDAPLLLEAGADVFCNQILVVLAPAALRMQRIMRRDNLTESLARARMQAQPEDDFYQEHADICLDGTLDSHALSCHVRQIVSGIVG